MPAKKTTKTKIKGIKPQWAKFAALIAGGTMNQTHAYMECFPDSTYEAARANAVRLIAQDSVIKEIKRLQDLADEGNVLSIREKREFLAAAIRTPISEIDENNPLATEITRTFGENGSSEKIKTFSKEKAIELDNKMAGHYEPEQVEHNVIIDWGEEESE